MTIWEFSKLVPGQTAFAGRVQDIAPALFAVPLVTNIVITALLIWRIKQAQGTVKITSNHKLHVFYRRVIRNTIESCIIYPFVLMVTLILYCRKDNGQDIVSTHFVSYPQPSSHAASPRSLPARWLKSCLLSRR